MAAKSKPSKPKARKAKSSKQEASTTPVILTQEEIDRRIKKSLEDMVELEAFTVEGDEPINPDAFRKTVDNMSDEDIAKMVSEQMPDEFKEPKEKKLLSPRKSKAVKEEKKIEPEKKSKTESEEESIPKISKIDDALKSLRRLEKTDRRVDSSSIKGAAPLFSHARMKERKCFAIGGLMTDIINQLKGQTYALAGTGFESDGTPIQRAKGRNWEEQYTEMLMYLATAEALGCTYQGQFSRLKDMKSQTEVSKALLDDLSTDLRKMTLYRSALGPRHLEVVRDVDSKIKASALEIQLANMQWDYGNMDRILELKDRYDNLSSKEKADLDVLVEKVRTDKSFKMTPAEEKVFFYPPTEKQLEDVRRLTGIREGKPKSLETLINDRKAIIQASYPTEITLRASADKVAAGLNDISKEVFGDLEEEKGAMRTLLAESLSLYSKDSTINSDTLSALVADEKHNFAKILEILGRLRIAREASEQQSIRDFRVDENLKKSAEAKTERDVLDMMAQGFISDTDQEVMSDSIKKSLDALFIHAKNAKTFDETKAVNDKIKAYKELYTLFEKTPLVVAGQDLTSMKAPKVKKIPTPQPSPETQPISEKKKVPNVKVRKSL